MGSPQYPTPEQVVQLNQASALPAPADMRLEGGRLQLTLGVNALVLVTVKH